MSAFVLLKDDILLFISSDQNRETWPTSDTLNPASFLNLLLFPFTMAAQDLAPVLQDTATTVVAAASQSMTRESRIQEIKADIWTRYSWDVMLAAAPIALELLGSCQVIASDEKARSIKLKQPHKGFRYLRG